jgi:hypothetical protein
VTFAALGLKTRSKSPFDGSTEFAEVGSTELAEVRLRVISR